MRADVVTTKDIPQLETPRHPRPAECGLFLLEDRMQQQPKAAPDWERIEAEYRAGLLSLREIAAPHGISETAIRKRAKRDDWTRDIAAKVKARSDDLVRKAEVRSSVRSDERLSERVLIESGAEAIAAVRMAHRGDIRRSRMLSLSLLEELEGQTADRELYAQLGELLRSESESGQDKLNDIYRKVISMPGRVDSMKKLSDTLKTLIGLEREAYGLESAAADDAPAGSASISVRFVGRPA